jgi:hypothetical protein
MNDKSLACSQPPMVHRYTKYGQNSLLCSKTNGAFEVTHTGIEVRGKLKEHFQTNISENSKLARSVFKDLK